MEEAPICEKCGNKKERFWNGTVLLGYWCPFCKSKRFLLGCENTRYRTDVCLTCGRIVRRDLKPDGDCPKCGNKTEWKFEKLYSENDT